MQAAPDLGTAVGILTHHEGRRWLAEVGSSIPSRPGMVTGPTALCTVIGFPARASELTD